MLEHLEKTNTKHFDFAEHEREHRAPNFTRARSSLAIRVAVVRVFTPDVLTINVIALQITNTTSIPMNANIFDVLQVPNVGNTILKDIVVLEHVIAIAAIMQIILMAKNASKPMTTHRFGF